MALLPVCAYYTPATGCELNRQFPENCRMGCPAYDFVSRAKAIQDAWYETVYPDKTTEDRKHAETD